MRWDAMSKQSWQSSQLSGSAQLMQAAGLIWLDPDSSG